MPDFTIKRHDLLPVLIATLSDADGAVDLTDPLGTTVKFVMVKDGDATPAINADAVVEDGPAGLVSYEWQPGDTDTAGAFIAEWQVNYADGVRITFPNDRSLFILITPDLSPPA